MRVLGLFTVLTVGCTFNIYSGPPPATPLAAPTVESGTEGDWTYEESDEPVIAMETSR